MYIRLKIYLPVLLIIFSFTSANGADIAKIGVVSFQRILKESAAGKAVAKKLREKQEERIVALKEKKKEIVKLQKFIESIELVGEKEEREEKKLELNMKLETFKELENRYSQELKVINTKYSDKIKNEVNDIVVEVGKKGGYLLIIEKEDALYSPDAVDITTKIVKQYNKKYGGE